MRRSNRLVFLIGVFLAALVFVAVLAGIGGGSGGPGSTATPGPVSIVVAAQDIALGTPIKAEMLATKTVTAAEAPTDALRSTLEAIGKTAQNAIIKDAPIRFADVNEPGLGSSIQKVDVPAGKRAMAVQVDQVSGVGTVIRKGDYVDAILLIDFPTTQIDPQSKTITVVQGVDSHSAKLLLQGMQVLGTLLPPAAPAPSAAPGATQAPAGVTLNGQQEIVILAVDPQQAEVLRFAQTGTPPAPITLILRAKQDFLDANGQPTTPPDVKTTGIVLKTLITNYGVLTPEVIEAILPSPKP